MPYSVTGHYVQVWRDAFVDPMRVEYVEVGRIGPYIYTGRLAKQAKHAGWHTLKNAMNKRDAKRMAKDLKKVGFHSRVRIRTHSGIEDVAEYKPRGNK